MLLCVNATASSEIYTLSLHDALPIFAASWLLNRSSDLCRKLAAEPLFRSDRKSGSAGMPRPISYAVFCLKKKYVYGHKAASDVRDEFVSVTEKLMDELAQCYNVLPQL